MEPCDIVRSELSRWTDWDIDTMVAISHAESNCRADAIGDTNLTFEKNGRTYGYSIGALQVRILPGREWIEGGDYYAGAHEIWLSQGYRAWTCYTNNSYMRYL